MMAYKKERFLVGFVMLCLIILLYGVASAGGDDDRQVIIDATIPADVKPGDKPIALKDALLQQLFPELSHPRVMSYVDMKDEMERTYFMREGYTFLLRDDFNEDGFADIAFVGRYTVPKDSTDNSFFAIISFRKQQVIRSFFFRIQNDRAALLRIPHYKFKRPGILVAYVMGSDDCEIVYWDGKKYVRKPCVAVW